MLGVAAFPALLPTFIGEWQLTKTDAGWINGIYFAGYLAAVPVLVSLTDRVSPRNIYTLCLVLTALSAMFLMREIHFYGSHRATYFALAAILIWAWRWRERLLEPIARGSTRRWLYSALLVYFLSQLMDRRGLRILPHEQAIHVAVEEMLENAGHLLWIMTAVVTRRALRGN